MKECNTIKISSSELKKWTKNSFVEEVLMPTLGYDAKAPVAAILDQLVSCVTTALKDGHAVALRGSKALIIRRKKERPGRNPKTGESIPIAERNVIVIGTFSKHQGEQGRIGINDLVDLIAKSLPEQDRDCIYQIVKMFFKLVADVKNGTSCIEIRGLFSVYPVLVKAYVGRNPKSGDSVDVPDRIRAQFRVSKPLLRAIN